ncbi:MAG: hypothetical protein J6N95_05565 [Bacilli bacterium]|nr:hypothetical protein [Bacilli bacterium]
MRLIDKDSLLKIINCNKPLADGYHMKDYVFNQIITDINNEPIVKAIPIDWLEKKISNAYSNFDLDVIAVLALADILNDWRKEND